MSERWCDDCSWPYECMADHACRRAEQGERRVAATAETAGKIELLLVSEKMADLETVRSTFLQEIAGTLGLSYEQFTADFNRWQQ